MATAISSRVSSRKTVRPAAPVPAPRLPRNTAATTVSPADSAPPSGHATIRMARHAAMVRSALNVRRKATDVTELAALIRAQGLLHNLVAYPQMVGGLATGIVEVVAGGRRLDAIGLLIADGSLPSDYGIAYLLVTEDEAVAISMAENRGRADMHPADVCAAMTDLIRRGRSVDDIALGFGLDVLTVRRCLKLANISPRLLELYRNDEANFEHMMALALSDDHAAQELAWDSLHCHHRHPHELRRLLTAQQINVQRDPLARFVGVDAFEQAGGVVTRDLFSDAGAGYIADAALLEKLARVKLEQHRATLDTKGLAWVEILPRADNATLAAFASVRTVLRPLTAEQASALAALNTRIDTTRQALDGREGGESGNALAAELDQLERQRNAMLASRPSVAHPDDKALAGAVLTLDDHGGIVFRRDLIRAADKGKMSKIAAADAPAGSVRRRPVHSDRLTHMLTSHRTAALQAEMLNRPDVALAVLTHALLSAMLPHQSGGSVLAKLGLREPVLAAEAKAGPAAAAVAARREQMLARLPDAKDGRLLAWLMQQSQFEVMEWLAFCVACSLDATQSREGPCAGFKALALALKLDMGAWWKPTAENYFNHVSKERSMAVVAAAVSREASVPLENMARAAAAQAAGRAVADTGWLPDMLR